MGPMMSKSEACCEGCQGTLTVPHVGERCAAFSDKIHMFSSPPIYDENVLGEDCDIESH